MSLARKRLVVEEFGSHRLVRTGLAPIARLRQSHQPLRDVGIGRQTVRREIRRFPPGVKDPEWARVRQRRSGESKTAGEQSESFSGHETPSSAMSALTRKGTALFARA
jgi:hypothetical protein